MKNVYLFLAYINEYSSKFILDVYKRGIPWVRPYHDVLHHIRQSMIKHDSQSMQRIRNDPRLAYYDPRNGIYFWRTFILSPNKYFHNISPNKLLESEGRNKVFVKSIFQWSKLCLIHLTWLSCLILSPWAVSMLTNKRALLSFFQSIEQQWIIFEKCNYIQSTSSSWLIWPWNDMHRGKKIAACITLFQSFQFID